MKPKCSALIEARAGRYQIKWPPIASGIQRFPKNRSERRGVANYEDSVGSQGVEGWGYQFRWLPSRTGVQFFFIEAKAVMGAGPTSMASECNTV